MTKLSTYFYLAVLSIADTFVLYVGLLRMWVGELTGSDIRNLNDWLCKLTVMLLHISSDYSVWLIIAVTVERYIAVCHPLKAFSMCNNSRAFKVVICIALLIVLTNSHFLWTIHVRELPLESNGTVSRCVGTPEHQVLVHAVWPWVDAVIYSFLPFVVITVLNSLIINQVFKSHRGREHLQNGSPSLAGRGRHNRYSDQGSRLTVMLLTVSFSFLLTTLPMNILVIIIELFKVKNYHQLSQLKLASTVMEMLMYMNHSINFFLYCATGQKFRLQIHRILCRKQRSGAPSMVSYNSNGTDHTKSIRFYPRIEADAS